MNTKQQHIVFLTPGFPASEKDLTTIPALQIYLKALKKAVPKIALTIIAFQFPFTKKTYSWHDIKVIPINGKNNKFKKLWIWNTTLQTLKKIHKETPITTIHSFWIGECSFIGIKFSKKHLINHITTAMGQDVKPNNRYMNSLIQSNSKIISLSKNHQSILFKNYKLNSQIIPWGISIDEFSKNTKSTIDILGVGSLNTIKNFAFFIAIIAEVVKMERNLKVEIIGEGKHQKKLLQQINNLELNNTITLLGKLPRNKVLEKMSKSKILLHTSSFESFGMVFIEAYYSNMNIVSFDVGIAKEVENNIICSDKKDMVQQILNILKTAKPNSPNPIFFSIDNTVTTYLKLYNA